MTYAYEKPRRAPTFGSDVLLRIREEAEQDLNDAVDLLAEAWRQGVFVEHGELREAARALLTMHGKL